MPFLSPGFALAAALVAIPALILLYLLKLRRRMLRMPSTMLWDSTREDMEANAPFRRLRFSFMLLLQLLVLLLLLFALAQPFTLGSATSADRFVILVDRSASMQVVADADAGATRLDVARRIASEVCEQVLGGGRPARVMIISFAAEPVVECSATTDRRLLMSALEAIGPTDEPADLQRALDLAGAHARPAGEDETTAAEVVLISDGGLGAEGEGLSLESGRFRFVQVGAPDDGSNVGIVALAARRPYEDPGTVNVFVRAVNTGPEPVETAFALRLDGRVEGLTSLAIPAATREDGALLPGEATTEFTMQTSAGGVIDVGHAHSDAFDVDDRGWLVMPPPRPPRIVLVHAGDAPDPFLIEVVEAMEPGSLQLAPASNIDRAVSFDADGRPTVDFVIFDRVGPARLPTVPSLTVGASAGDAAVLPTEREGGQRFVTWERRHPILRHVDLDQLAWAGFDGFRLPDDATTLARGRGGPVIALLEASGARHVLVGFAIERSNWAVDVSFTVFMLNVIEHLTLAESTRAGRSSRPGAIVDVRPRPAARRVTIAGPFDVPAAAADGGATSPAAPPTRVVADLDGIDSTIPIVFRAPSRVGMYAIDGVLSPDDRLAVSLLSDEESGLRVRDSVVVNARPVRAAGPSDTVPREWWRLLVAAAGIVLVVEWLAYCLRMNR